MGIILVIIEGEFHFTFRTPAGYLDAMTELFHSLRGGAVSTRAKVKSLLQLFSIVYYNDNYQFIKGLQTSQRKGHVRI